MAPEALKKGSVFERRNEEIRMHLVTTSKAQIFGGKKRINRFIKL